MKRPIKIRWQLVLYDAAIAFSVYFFLLFLYKSNEDLSLIGVLEQAGISFACVFSVRVFGNVYGQIWRYGGIRCYIRLLFADAVAFAFTYIFEALLPVEHLTFARLLSVASVNLLCVLASRMMYRYCYKYANTKTPFGRLLNLLLRIFAGKKIERNKTDEIKKKKLAIVGAGNVGAMLAEELLNNPRTEYLPRCFVDTDSNKVGRVISGIPVYSESEVTFEHMRELDIDQIVIAIPDLSSEQKKRTYDRYSSFGRPMIYDFPVLQTTDNNGKRNLRNFEIEELLFRTAVVLPDEGTGAYYRDKVILITGGGGSIGSELCRQLARMSPKQIIVLDIYENGAYDVQQELNIAYKNTLDIRVEIVSITNKTGVERVFEAYHPNIVIMAAAHKHLPLMEHNCIEAVENNVFGTKNIIELCEEYGSERFMMVSTDKAVNPTNVMGATKRLCEMMTLAASTEGRLKCSATRFGNVLGSAGSVVPLFKKQIASGGPVTVTDKRITRYFMTIPEASQLVLQSGAMANNGEIFVLDMGQPVKIYDLAENMIRLSGARGIEIIETGLRPGEKLYEELLVDKTKLEKTENELIYIEKSEPFTQPEIEDKLDTLKAACETGDDALVKSVLRQVVPTYRNPDEVNSDGRDTVRVVAFV